MREIKSRGKSTNTGKWVYGYFCYDWDSKGNLKPCIQSSFTEFDTSFSRTIVIPETVGQLTGLKDKNNNDIYEGDAIDTGIHKVKGYVELHQGCFSIKVTESKSKYIDIGQSIPLYEFETLEVIGNIHENKNLLETSLA